MVFPAPWYLPREKLSLLLVKMCSDFFIYIQVLSLSYYLTKLWIFKENKCKFVVPIKEWSKPDDPCCNPTLPTTLSEPCWNPPNPSNYFLSSYFDYIFWGSANSSRIYCLDCWQKCRYAVSIAPLLVGKEQFSYHHIGLLYFLRAILFTSTHLKELLNGGR